MKVFLDTNVLAAGFATRGLCSDIIRETFENHELITSLEILSELNRILRNKFKVPAEQVEEVLKLIHSCGQISEPNYQASYEIADKDDVPHLSAAETAECEYFVTGDKELWSVSPIGTMQVLSPRDFWKAKQAQPLSRGYADKPQPSD
jgi:putative PIN family toxin of toxin-antitoxin system